MPSEPKMPSEHHSFKAAHHTKMAKIKHMEGKMHEMAAAHHSKMAGGESEPDMDDGMDEQSDTVQNTQPMSFGRGAR